MVRETADCEMRTRGLTAWAADAQDRQRLLAGSSPHVIWICSGVPSADLSSAGAPKPCEAAAPSSPERPAPVTNVRREMRPDADRSFAAPIDLGVRFLPRRFSKA